MPHGTGPCAAHDDHSETVQAGGAGGPEQDTDHVTPAKQLPGKRPAPSGDDAALPGARSNDDLTDLFVPTYRDLARAGGIGMTACRGSVVSTSTLRF